MPFAIVKLFAKVFNSAADFPSNEPLAVPKWGWAKLFASLYLSSDTCFLASNSVFFVLCAPLAVSNALFSCVNFSLVSLSKLSFNFSRSLYLVCVVSINDLNGPNLSKSSTFVNLFIFVISVSNLDINWFNSVRISLFNFWIFAWISFIFSSILPINVFDFCNTSSYPLSLADFLIFVRSSFLTFSKLVNNSFNSLMFLPSNDSFNNGFVLLNASRYSLSNLFFIVVRSLIFWVNAFWVFVISVFNLSNSSFISLLAKFWGFFVQFS